MLLKQASSATPVDEATETPFYIPGTASSARPRRTLKHGDCFAVLDGHADIGAEPGGPDGIFYRDTRYLSRLEMLLNGTRPLLLGPDVRDDNSTLTVDLTNPDIYLDQQLVLPKDTLRIVRTFFLWRGMAYQRLRVRAAYHLVEDRVRTGNCRHSTTGRLALLKRGTQAITKRRRADRFDPRADAEPGKILHAYARREGGHSPRDP